MPLTKMQTREVADRGFVELERLCRRFHQVCQSASDQREPSLTSPSDDLPHLIDKICGVLDSPEMRRASPERLVEFSSTVFAENVVRWLKANPFMARLWDKPSGYSGDYWTIETICQDDREIKDWHDHIRNYILSGKMSWQHRHKVAEQSAFIRRIIEGSGDGPKRLLNIGCGPSYDVRIAIRQTRPDTVAEFHLVDLDPDAIDFSKDRLVSTDHLRFTFTCKDVLRVIKQQLTEGRHGSYDGILFGGLFDYLDDRCIALLLRKANLLLSDRGEILFSQVSTSNPDRTLMRWFGDWVLIERDEPHLVGLCAKAGFGDDHLDLWREPSGHAILCQLKKASGRGTCTDLTAP